MLRFQAGDDIFAGVIALELYWEIFHLATPTPPSQTQVVTPANC